MLHVNNDPDKFYDEVVMPYKGFLEEWYVSRQNISFYFIFIGLTVWVVLRSDSDLVWKLFEDLPAPPSELESAINFLK
jgi:hypothetical protein